MSQEGKKPYCVIGGECIGNVPTIEGLEHWITQYITIDPKLNLSDLNEKSHESLENVSEDQHHSQQHELNGNDHLVTGTLDWVKISKVDSDIADLTYRFHSDLQNIGESDHHVKTVSGEISLANLLEKAHASLSGVSTSQHHVKTVSSEILLASMGEKNYNSLANKPVIGVGVVSSTVVYSNDGEKSKVLDDVDYKIKEIIIYISIERCTISWEHRSGTGVEVRTRIFINGIIYGSSKGTNSTSYVSVSQGITQSLFYNDKIQIYIVAPNGSPTGFVKNMRINYDMFVSNDP